MKKMQILSPLLLALGLTGSMSALAAGAANAPVVVSEDAAGGSIELSNISGTENQEPVAPEPKAQSITTDVVPAEQNSAEAPKDPRELHRDKVMLMPEEIPAGTTAASRRYKKVDLATYRANMQNAASQAPVQKGGSSPVQ
jgi:hypothetical protein